MKMNKLALLGLLLLGGCSTSNPEVPEQITAIKSMLDAQVKSWNQGDIPGFMKGYLNDSNMQFISKRGSRKGWQQTLDAYKKHYPTKDSMGKLYFAIDTVEFLDNQASFGHITGKWKLIRSSDTPSGYFSLITKKTLEGPKIIIDHTW